MSAPRDLTEYTERFPVHTGLYNPRATMRPKSELENDKKKMDSSTTFK